VDEAGQPVDAMGGKRIRPTLCLLACEAASEGHEAARPAAAAIEIIHNFSLLHDDIQDKSPTRRGRSTAWTIWGPEQAINAGDALFALAHLAIPRLGEQIDPPLGRALRAEMLHILDETCLELTRGQHLDMSFEEKAQVTTEAYMDMVAGKTAALLGAAAHLGALAAGVDVDSQHHYEQFGVNLGMAFQVQDDVLDIWGDPEVTGKEAAIDIHQRKKSLPVLYGLERSAALRDLYASPEAFDETTVSRAIDLLDQTGAQEYARALAKDYSTRTIDHLEAANPHSEAGEQLLELVRSLLERDR